MKTITLKEVEKNPFVSEFIKQSEIALRALNYTDHGLRHSVLVAARARTLALGIGLTKREQELAAISAYCHDFANFLSRNYHSYLGALLFQQIFKNEFSAKELTIIMQAIATHDSDEMNFTSPISAVVVLADKSDVRRDRVIIKDLNLIKSDIHNRVNYAVKAGKLGFSKDKTITLSLKINTHFVPVMEYFEIFTERMAYCRKAAEYLNYHFGLVINNFKLL